MDNKKVSEILAGQRTKLKLTQTMLAEKLLVSPKTISKWESGRGLPSIDILPELSKVLEISIDELLNNEPKGNSHIKEIDDFDIARIMSPRYIRFTEPINSILTRDWLRYILCEEGLTVSEFYNFVSQKNKSKNKPKTVTDCIDRILDVNVVTIASVQRALKIGFSKAARLRELMVKNCLIDKDFFVWKDKHRGKLEALLTKEIKISVFNEKQDLPTEEARLIEKKKINFEEVILINDKLSEKEKTCARNLLKACSPKNSLPEESVVSCFDYEKLQEFLQETNNRLNVEIYNINEMEDFSKNVKIENAEKLFLVLETSGNKKPSVFDLLRFSNLKVETEISLKINNNLKSKYKATVFY